MSSAGVLLERVTCVAPLGLRFWDAVTNSVVGQGLKVEAYPRNEPFRRVASFLTVGGFHAFRGLPGMRDVENGAIGLDALSAKKPFVVEVSDLTRSRFLPFAITTDVPVAGLFPWEVAPDASPLASPLASGPPAVPLFSAPHRPVPAGMAAVRADLWDAVADGAASGALLEVTAPGLAPVVGMADGNGRVAVLLPYPEPATPLPPPGSPPGGSARSLTQQEWTVQIRAYFRPSATADFPNLSDNLRQPKADLWFDSARVGRLTEGTLRFGQELIVRSHDAVSLAPLSKLLITATAASPP